MISHVSLPEELNAMRMGNYVLQEDRIPPLQRIDGSRFLMYNLRSLLNFCMPKALRYPKNGVS
jgi:hypothetical protein